MLIYAIIAITLALIFYTIGVWSEKIQGNLKKAHVYIFWIGLTFDTIGTTLMSKLAEGSSTSIFHGVTGAIAIILMFIHVLWATRVMIKNDPKIRSNFHKLSLFVWLIWLIPFVSGAMFGMAR